MNKVMHFAELLCHPAAPERFGAKISAEVGLGTGHLSLSYEVTGIPGQLRLPAGGLAVRQDNLWRHTCFEAFIKLPDHSNYYEFNFSPSSAWAAYAFSCYRQDQVPLALRSPPGIVLTRPGGNVRLDAVLNLEDVPDLYSTGAMQLGLSAVLELESGELSYWALAHPVECPDFHHAGGFDLHIGLRP